MSEDSLVTVVAEVVAEHPAEWARYCEGDDADRKKLSGVFIGGVMRATRNQANGQAVRAELERLRI
jgi:aspartyl-tRNA(Asn)/glutamyl-tRNA(Gln) amidotransferase subunit B